jgi:hypothetical protein
VTVALGLEIISFGYGSEGQKGCKNRTVSKVGDSTEILKEAEKHNNSLATNLQSINR